ncbi:MAG: MBL fold metallo-hydrolase [Litorimonas sp.]
MKKLGLSLVVILVSLFVAGQLFKVQIGERLFAKAVSDGFGNNVLSDLPDGLHVILIGTGSPLADPSRAGPSTAVIAGKRVFIIDSGGGAVRKMGEIGLSPAATERVLLTHFHSDHIDGLGELMLQRWAGGGYTAPMPIHGPTGVTEVVNGLNLAYTQDKGYRVAHHGADIVPPSGFGGTPIEFEAGLVLDQSGVKILAFEVDHEPVSPSFGYRFEYKGRSVVITGDTAYSDDLARHAENADILISEALNPDMVGVIETAARDAGNNRIGKIMYDIPDYHITPLQAAEVAQDANAGLLVFTHIVPALPTSYLDAVFKKGAADKFSGDIVVGQDGMMFSLKPQSDGIMRRQLK